LIEEASNALIGPMTKPALGWKKGALNRSPLATSQVEYNRVNQAE
jgi:hypothetical protein